MQRAKTSASLSDKNKFPRSFEDIQKYCHAQRQKISSVPQRASRCMTRVCERTLKKYTEAQELNQKRKPKPLEHAVQKPKPEVLNRNPRNCF